MAARQSDTRRGHHRGPADPAAEALESDTARLLAEQNATWALSLARRVTVILYAAIGLVLTTASETVRRARERSAERAERAPEPAPASLSGVRIVTSSPTATPAPVHKAID